MKSSIFLVFLMFSPGLFAQNLDSLWSVWEDKTLADTTRIKALNSYVLKGFVHEKPDSGIYFAQIQYDFASSRNLKKAEGLALNNLGLCYKTKKEFEKAEKYFNKSFAIQEEIDNAIGMGYPLYNLAKIYEEKGDIKRAEDYWLKRLAVFETLGNDEYERLALWDLSSFYYTNEEPDLAISYRKQTIRKKRLIGDDIRLTQDLGWVAFLYAKQNQLDSALFYRQEQLIWAKKTMDTSAIINSYGNLSFIYYGLGHFAKALDYCFLEESYISSNSDNRLIYLYDRMASIYEDGLGDYELALTYYLKAFEVNKKAEKPDRIGFDYSNLGLINDKLKKHDEAITWLNKGVVWAKENEDDEVLALSYAGLSEVYFNLNDLTKSMEYTEKIVLLVNREGFKTSDADNQLNLLGQIGKTYLHAADYSNAITYCGRAFEKSVLAQNYIQQKVSCKCLFTAYGNLGINDKALVYMQKFISVSDTLSKREASKAIQKVQFDRQLYNDSIALVEKDRQVLETHQEEMRAEEKTRNISLGIGLFVLLLAGGLYSRLSFVRKSKATLQIEKDRSENLLLNILPADIAAELKEKGKADARDFDMVSILFTDFKGFTAASEKLSAQDLVSEINTCFEAFDGIMGKYNIEKIKTIGDAYMAAGGLPVPTEGSVRNTVLAALEMQEFIAKRKTNMDAKGLPAFEMRVGIHTGPVVAGIVGVKKFAYDIWGDTVNTASRMESSGEVDKVNISQATYKLIKGDSGLCFESRGKIEAKGKGEIEMWFVSRKE